MAKGDKGYERTQIEQQNNKSNALYDDYYNTLNSERPELRKKANEERGFLNTGYQNFANTGGLSPEDEARLRAVGGGGGGSAFDPSAYVNRLNDPNRLADVRDTTSKLKSFKAFSPTDTSEIQRQHYRDLESTGGYGERDIRQMKESAGSVVPSFYSSLRDRAGRGLAVQGSANNPTGGAANFKMIRDASKAATQSSLDSDLAIKDKVLAGKLQGADRLSQNQMQMRSIGAPLEMQGLQSAGSLGLGTAQEDRAGIGDAYGMEHTFAEENNANARSAAAGNSALEKYILEARNSGKMYGLDSLKDLYGATPGELSQNDALRLNALGQRGGEMQGWRNASLNNDQINRSKIFENIAGIAGAGAGVAGGLSNLKRRPTGNTGFNVPAPTLSNVGWG